MSAPLFTIEFAEDMNPERIECPQCESQLPLVVEADAKWEYDGKSLKLVDLEFYGGTTASCEVCGWRAEVADFDVRPAA